MTEEIKLSAQEGMKVASKYLKGNILEDLASDKVDISNESYELLKFHGTYFGYDRDSATERKKAGLDKEYEFMLRLRIVAGKMTAQQYLDMNDVVDKYANGTLKITTRETLQFHCISKNHLKDAIDDINKSSLSTLSACGDVVRNVMTSPTPFAGAKYDRLHADALAIKDFCAPKTSSYDEIWNDAPASNRDKPADKVEPLYGDNYLPRKFKIGVITPEDNSIDIYSHDLGFISIYDGDKLLGYDVVIGGGLGCKHNQSKTYPRVASHIAFIGEGDLLRAVEAVVRLQSDHGDRSNRNHARLKYVVEENGVEWTKDQFKKYFAATPIDIKTPNQKIQIPDHMGWHSQNDGKFYLGVPIPSGRIVNYDKPHKTGYNIGENKKFANSKYLTAFKKIFTEYGFDLIFTADQNILICNIEESQKTDIENILRDNNIPLREDHTWLARNFMTCVALPTCGKALAEAERVQFQILDDIQQSMDKNHIGEEKISVRVTGCPNGCARPFLGDVGIVGRMPGHYVLYIGGDFEGTRLNQKTFDKVPQNDLGAALSPMFELYNKERNDNEGFGDFCHRYDINKVAQYAVEKLGDQYKWAKI